MSLRRSDAVALPFPILIFQERVLSPALGYIFNPAWIDPHESILSILWKFGKSNSLPGHVVAGLLHAHTDPYDGVEATRDAVDIRRLRASLCLPLKTLRGSLIPSSPYRPTCRFFRYCPVCMSRGYHCVVHQFDVLKECPIHKRALESACRDCGYRAPYHLNALLLDAPYRCAQCGRIYGNAFFSIYAKRPMSKRHRVLMCKSHFKIFYC